MLVHCYLAYRPCFLEEVLNVFQTQPAQPLYSYLSIGFADHYDYDNIELAQTLKTITRQLQICPLFLSRQSTQLLHNVRSEP